MQHKVLVATKEHTGGALSLPFPLLVLRVGTSGMGGAALPPSPSLKRGQGGAAPLELGNAFGPWHLDLLFEAGWCLNAALQSLE